LSLAFPEPADDMARSDGSLFAYELRKEGRPVAALRGFPGANGAVTVQTEIYPVTAPASADPQVRPFAFPTREQANRFVEEALIALEYLGCSLAE
jgi:hypothetical protein